MRDADARRRLREELARHACSVHQPEDPPLFTREPRSPMRSHHWRWLELEPLLRKLGEGVELGAQGPRRTIRLSTPGLAAGTTPTFWASIQVILPGEVAGAHRHSASAFRFIMRGGGATTTVDGERYPMHEGDLVLTPAGTWHDHEYQGVEPMVWLDVLDIPLMSALHASFFESHAEASQPVSDVPEASWRRFGSGLLRPVAEAPPQGNPLLAYPARVSRQALTEAEGVVHDDVEGTRLAFQNPTDGGDAMRTMALSIQSLPPGFRGHRRRSTASRLYYAVEGSGTLVTGDASHRWVAGDLIVVAPWEWHRHEADAGARRATLFQVNDEPVYRRLGFYREEREAAQRMQ